MCGCNPWRSLNGACDANASREDAVAPSGWTRREETQRKWTGGWKNQGIAKRILVRDYALRARWESYVCRYRAQIVARDGLRAALHRCYEVVDRCAVVRSGHSQSLFSTLGLAVSQRSRTCIVPPVSLCSEMDTKDGGVVATRRNRRATASFNLQDGVTRGVIDTLHAPSPSPLFMCSYFWHPVP